MKRIWKIAASSANLARWRRRLQSSLERPSYVPLVAGIAALNSFLPFFPVEVFLILRVLVRPKEWWRNAAFAAVASAIGVMGLARLVQSHSQSALAMWLTHSLGKGGWEHVTHFVHHRGSIGLLFASISFVPLPPAVIMCALSKVPLWQIALSIALGHCVKYGFFSWLAARSPLWFADSDQKGVSL
jgi:membrane protein YqaA with SNARE-associated domain